MPFIRGRFHINRIAGEALEAAGEAEAALAALRDAEHVDGPDRHDDSPKAASCRSKSCRHMQAAHNTRFVARIHRAGYARRPKHQSA